MQGNWAILAWKSQACKILSRLNKEKHTTGKKVTVFIENQKV